jgi:hypothetical protein
MAAAQQLAAQQSAAMGDMGKYLSAHDPVRAAAADTSGNPVARWAMLRSTPQQVIQMRQAMAETQLKQAELPYAQARGREAAGGTAFGGVPTIGGGVAPAPAPPAMPTAPPAGAPAPLQGAGPPDPLANMPPAGQQRLAWLQGLPPAQQKAILARLRAQQPALTGPPTASPEPPTPAR